MSVEAQLADFIVDTTYEQLPRNSLAVVRCSLFDYCACAIAGENQPVATVIRQMLNQQGGMPAARVFGQQQRLPARSAALVNGACAHALDYDDTHFDYIGHTSVAVMPAAIALAEQLGVTGKQFLLAAQIGVEVACRVGAYMGRSHYEAGFHQTATSGSFGAAAAAAKLLALDKQQCLHMFGLLSSRASGLKNQFGTMGKPYNAGMAAANGVEVAQLVYFGMDSIDEGLQGDYGFSFNHHGESNAQALAGLGDSYRFDYISHKLHACCHGTHASLEALALINAQHTYQANQVNAIHVQVHPRWLKVCNNPQPSSGLQAKFSYAMVIAMQLNNLNTADPQAFTDELHTRPELRSCLSKVHVQGIESLTDTQAVVVVELDNGRQLQASYDCGVPLSVAQMQTKLLHKAQVLLGEQRANQLLGNIEQISRQVSFDLAVTAG